MVYFTIAFLCSALIFMTLLNDKYRLPVAAISNGVIYLVSLGLTKLIGLFTTDAALFEPLGILINAFLLFLLSLFIYQNNPVQKLHLAVLAMSNFFFIRLFSEMLLGLMPFPVSGAFAALFSILLYVLFTALMILSFYRVLHHFHDRDISGFMIIITLLQTLPCIFCMGQVDFLFRSHIYAGRIFLSVTVYLMILFASRSIYQAARFREAMTKDAARMELVDTQSSRYIELYSYIQSVRHQRDEENYHLDTIVQMIQEGATPKIPYYIADLREKENDAPLLKDYSENPYVNAVMAVNAAYAESNGIEFSCSVLLQENSISTVDTCMMSSEMLRRAMEETARYSGEKCVRCTVTPANDLFRLEVIYTAPPLPKKETLSLRSFQNMKGQKLSDIVKKLFEETETDQLAGLNCTKDIVSRYSGKLDVSVAGNEVILSVEIHT